MPGRSVVTGFPGKWVGDLNFLAADISVVALVDDYFVVEPTRKGDSVIYVCISYHQ